MNNIILIKTNGFVDVIESSIEISDDYIELDTVQECLDGFDDGMFVLRFKTVHYDSGQMGDFGQYEIPPYYYIDDYTVSKKVSLKSYVTKAERKYNRIALDERRAKKLQEYVSSFDTGEVRFSLSKLWGGHDSLAFREVTGSTFQIYKTIHTFDNDSPSVKNTREIKQFIDSYFTNTN